ncbi:MAG: sugar O-acetyltransferase [Alphaproteobacteria bacterium]
MSDGWTEKELMLAGKMYDSLDAELVKDRLRAKGLCHEFNQTPPKEQERRFALMNKLFGTDKNPYIEPSFQCDYGYNINVGERFYANHNCVFLDVNTITFGDDVMIGPNVQIYTASHPLDPIARYSGRELGFPITIGSRVWMGGNVVILPNVTIGDNVVIAAGAVVTKDVPNNAVVAGNPAKIIRMIDG